MISAARRGCSGASLQQRPAGGDGAAAFDQFARDGEGNDLHRGEHLAGRASA
jgi:hypothetical protein